MATKKATELESKQQNAISVNERFSNDQLRSIASLEDAMKLVAQSYGGVQSIEEFELGTGFKLLDDKDKGRLVDVPFVILHYQFNEGDFGKDFVSVTLITADANQLRLILNDGGTGICDQLRDVATTGRYGGIMVPGGLRVSEYDTCVACGKPRKESALVCSCGDDNAKRSKGATYYLEVSG